MSIFPTSGETHEYRSQQLIIKGLEDQIEELTLERDALRAVNTLVNTRLYTALDAVIKMADDGKPIANREMSGITITELLRADWIQLSVNGDDIYYVPTESGRKVSAAQQDDAS